MVLQMTDLPDLSIVQVTILVYLATQSPAGRPVLAADLRSAVRADFPDVGKGAMWYQILGRLEKRGLVDKDETITPGTDALPAVTYQLTEGGAEALDGFQEWHKKLTGHGN